MQDKISNSNQRPRRGVILVWFVLLLVFVLLGITGLVVDGGLLMATRRHLQNGTDAAAMAAAHDLILGKSVADANATANDFIKVHHQLAKATVVVNSPPLDGPYAGEPGFVEVIAKFEVPTLFMHAHLPYNGAKTHIVATRATAGSEAVESIDGIIALDPNAKPGLAVTGNAKVRVPGRVLVNSEGGGVDTDGNPVDGTGFGAFVSPFAGIDAEEVRVVGGVNRTDRFGNINGGESVLVTGALPVADPFLNLDTPTIANGVVNVKRGAPLTGVGVFELNNPDDTSGSPNRIDTDPVTGEQTMILKPGIYSAIDVDGGNVKFEPGIYVIASPNGQTSSIVRPGDGGEVVQSPVTRERGGVRILSGNVEADGILFYNTTDEYDAVTGGPDALDGGLTPADTEEEFGEIVLNANLGFTGIDTEEYDYGLATDGISVFNNMLIYQRRQHTASIRIQGFSNEGDFGGAIYAKWSNLKLAVTGGVFNSQIVVGSFHVPGHGDLTINYASNKTIKAPLVFLVE